MRATTELYNPRAALAAVVLCLVAACSEITETSKYDWTAGIGQQSCRAGLYYLPRRLLVFSVSPAAPSTHLHGLTFEPTTAGMVAASDPRVPLCLDYLAVSTADDKIVIDRTPDGLLKKISANAEDKSLEIAKAAIDVARLSAVVAGAPRANIALKNGSEALAAKFQMDPFDIPEAAAINHALKDMGYCIYVEGYTFDPKHLTPESYCRNPRAAIAGASRYLDVDVEALLKETGRGVLYRPNMPHRLVVMRKLDPRGPGRWLPWQTLAVEMPNAAPIFSVGVDRTLFTERKTTLTFAEGVLTNVSVTKGSELNSIVEIPLRIAQAVVSVPAQIIQVRIDRTNNEAVLIATQAKLLETYRDFRNERELLEKVAETAPTERTIDKVCEENAGPDPTKIEDCKIMLKKK